MQPENPAARPNEPAATTLSYRTEHGGTIAFLIGSGVVLGGLGILALSGVMKSPDGSTFASRIIGALLLVGLVMVWRQLLPALRTTVQLTDRDVEVVRSGHIVRTYPLATSTFSHGSAHFARTSGTKVDRSITVKTEEGHTFPLPLLRGPDFTAFVSALSANTAATITRGPVRSVSSDAEAHPEPEGGWGSLDAPVTLTASRNGTVRTIRRSALVLGLAVLAAAILIPVAGATKIGALAVLGWLCAPLAIVAAISLAISASRYANGHRQLTIAPDSISVDADTLYYSEIAVIGLSPKAAPVRLIHVEFHDGSTHDWEFFGSTKSEATDPFPRWLQVVSLLDQATENAPEMLRMENL